LWGWNSKAAVGQLCLQESQSSRIDARDLGIGRVTKVLVPRRQMLPCRRSPVANAVCIAAVETVIGHGGKPLTTLKDPLRQAAKTSIH